MVVAGTAHAQGNNLIVNGTNLVVTPTTTRRYDHICVINNGTVTVTPSVANGDKTKLGNLELIAGNQPLVNRLKRIQAWPLLTIWDSGAATLYVGVNRHGEPGVHLRQKRKDRGSLAPRGRFVLIASPATSGEPRVAGLRR